MIDLANAFFCLPLAPELQPIFVFTYDGLQYTYNRMPQGLSLTPGIFNTVLRDLFSGLKLPKEVLLVQHVDDLLIAAPTLPTCLEASKKLLHHLAAVGFKVSEAKLQPARRQVVFLAQHISSDGATLTAVQREAILHHPQPVTVRDMLAFLGLTNFSRHFVPDYAEKTAPLRELVRQQGHMNLTGKLEWSPVSEEAFVMLKQTLSRAAALAIPDYTLKYCCTQVYC